MNEKNRGRGVVIRVLAHACFGCALTIWFDLFRGCTFDADQVIGLTIMFTVACLLIDEIARSIMARQAPQPDIHSFFEEI